MIERLLRWTATGIAMLAFVDPAPTLSGVVRPRVSVATSGGGEAAASIRRAIRDRLRDDFEIIDGLDRSANAIVLIGDRYPDVPLGEHANVSTVSLGFGARSSVSIRGIVAPRSVTPTTAIRLGIDIEAVGRHGSTSELSVRTAGAQVAHRTHTWNSDKEAWHEDLDVVPVGDGPFIFDVRADDSGASIVVDSASRLRVLVVESRPSWASAFVRRVLESDPRFDVSGVSAPSPGKLITSCDSPALPEDLRRFDAIVVGGLDRLSTGSLAAIERFARLRGGALILLPDGSVPTSLVERLIPGVTLRETLLERPAALDAVFAPSLQASELLEASNLPAGSDIVAKSPSSRKPVIWTAPSGDGHIVVSGALDAWRYRGTDDKAFERFWRSVISGAALSARPPIEVTLLPERASPGERVRVVARVRTLEREQLGERLAIGARVAGEAIRLWPDAAAGTFVGSFVADRQPTAPTRRVTVALADGASGSTLLVIDSRARAHAPTDPPLSWLAQTHGGVDVSPSTLGQLDQHLLRTITPASVAAVRHPMRSPWWFLPFAGCLSSEWWMRRRRGAR